MGALIETRCASDAGATRDEVSAQGRDIAQLSQRQAVIERKLEDLDARLLVLTRRIAGEPRTERPGPQRGRPESAPAGMAEPPSLPVVKLGPRAAPTASALPTQVSILEPPPEDMAMLAAPLPSREVPAAVDTGEFEEAQAAVSTGDIDRGVMLLEAFARNYPRHPQADNALVLLGVARLQSGEPALAAVPLQRVVAEYPAGDAVAEALLRLSECHQRLKNPGAARAALLRLVANHPGTPEARAAEARLPTLGGAAAERSPRAARHPPAR